MNACKRALSLVLAGALLTGSVSPALAAPLSPSCDEAFYATLDYYGQLQQSSVVKSYRTNGAASIVDYGVYDQVENLSNGKAPQTEDGTLTFAFDGEIPEKFYFEGKTSQPFEQLPWRTEVSYKRNGAPARAEDLGGQTGLFEIEIDVYPNPDSSDYLKQNLVLSIAAAFNDDDISSLEAPGAEVQLIGNLRTVLFVVLPGEEQHFSIRVGAEEFSFSGLAMLAMPATLQQIEQVASLRDLKETAEDSYRTLDDSLNVVLDSLDGMSGSLNAAANGLDSLNSARGAVSNGKSGVYANADAALGSLNGLADSLGQLDGYSNHASQAIADLNQNLNGVNGAVQGVKPQLEEVRRIAGDVKRNAEELRGLLTDVESYNKRATDISNNLAASLESLNTSSDNLSERLKDLRNALYNVRGMSQIKAVDNITINGMTTDQLRQSAGQVYSLYGQYQGALAAGKLPEGTSFEQAIILTAYQQYCQAFLAQAPEGTPPPSLEEFLQTEHGQAAAAQAKNAAQLYQTIEGMGGKAELEKQLALADQANQLIPVFNQKALPSLNQKIKEINGLVTGITTPTADVINELSNLCGDLTDSGLTADGASLARLCRDLLKTMKEHEGQGENLLDCAEDLADLASQTADSAEGTLAQADSLIQTLNEYEPVLQSAVADVQSLSASAQAALWDTSGALGSLEDLLRSTGPALNAGADQSLRGAAAALRQSTKGLSETGAIRDAKTALADLLEEQWDAHTGESDNLLLIDAAAPAQSMTSDKNPSPSSIQYIMRTQQIKAEDPEQAPETAAPAPPKTTFWGRVKTMFRDCWQGVKNLF